MKSKSRKVTVMSKKLVTHSGHSIATPLGWDTCESQVTRNHFICLPNISLLTKAGVEETESKGK